MKVILRRHLFLGGARYRDSQNPVEIPDEVDGKTVVLFSKGKAHDPETEIVLPKDVKLFEGEAPAKAPTKEKPVALSQLTKQPSNEELLEKKK